MPVQLDGHFSCEEEYNEPYKAETNWTKGAEYV